MSKSRTKYEETVNNKNGLKGRRKAPFQSGSGGVWRGRKNGKYGSFHGLIVRKPVVESKGKEVKTAFKFGSFSTRKRNVSGCLQKAGKSNIIQDRNTIKSGGTVRRYRRRREHGTGYAVF